ncbi:sensor domain-containing diguanylate cyclase [Pelomonas sp. SE-A7]|uniref:GGDEF domain-containing protein n=1 Tax=Pelomonas sp. SE-A7 TaxID=3054953 RepID=UPI00259CA4E9|nr:sensor domain-containing diguanylate cyclase [Pelomonas sp. SE-A7]MDM4767035.1 sensor domain-containing diguanylate cyclase [Pelomonas sp. SE-A7]
MKIAELPADEAARLLALQSLHLLDSEREERFDRFTRLARRLFNVPIALVSLIDADRQWFKSAQGLDELVETPRDISFCSHAILQPKALVIADARLDERFVDNPLVTGPPHIRFYAGRPLKAPSGHRVGTLCILDTRPRQLEAEDLTLLDDLADMVEHELDILLLATVDELTGLSNRRGFEALSRHALGLCRRLGRPGVLLFFDLDGFKSINDERGHAEGDRALQAFARILRSTFRESDVVARLGGDEFAVLLTNATPQDCDRALQRLTTAIYEHNAVAAYPLRYSVGRADFDPARHPDAATLLAEADQLMYRHKQSRRR